MHMPSPYQTPIDEIDAAARVLDPIFSGVVDPSKRAYGVFYKVGCMLSVQPSLLWWHDRVGDRQGKGVCGR